MKRLYWELRRERPAGWMAGLAADCLAQAKVTLASYGWRRLRHLRKPRRPLWLAAPGALPRRILMISHYSPPYRSVYGTQRIAAFIKYLSRSGWDISLVTTRPARAAEEESAGGDSLPARVTTVRLPQAPPRALRGLGLLVPDDCVRWILPAAEAASRVAEEKRVALVYATAPPYSNLLAAAICSNRLGLPLVSDFRDPWSRIDVAWVIQDPMLRRLNEALERAVLLDSDAVIMADELHYLEDFFVDSGKAVRRKIVSIGNGFDEEDFLGVQAGRREGDRDKFIISYVGVLYDDETFENLRRPLEAWHAQWPEDFERVLLEYAGPTSRVFDRRGFRPPYLRDHGYVSHAEAIAIRARSSVQLFSQPRSFKPHVLSGKIFEMIRTGVPILAVTNPSGAVARLVERTGAGFVVPQGDAVAAARMIHRLFKKWQSREALTTVNWDVVAEYSRERQTAKLADVFERVIETDQTRGKSALGSRSVP